VRRLEKKEIAAFVLKYRVRKLFTEDPWTEMLQNLAKKSFYRDFRPIIALELEDAKAFIMRLLPHTADYRIDPNRIGIIGFFARGTISAALTYNYSSTRKQIL
jgi:hypothetical protein